MPRVGKMLAAHRLSGRSPLYRWLCQHHDEIAAVFAAQVRPSWQALAETARDSKILDANGNAPNRYSVRKAWKTLKADMTQTLSHHPPAPLPIAVERQPAVFPSSPLPPNITPRERKPLVLRTARPLGPDELPQDDGSALPKPFSRTKP